jgi:hypothetical protein
MVWPIIFGSIILKMPGFRRIHLTSAGRRQNKDNCNVEGSGQERLIYTGASLCSAGSFGFAQGRQPRRRLSRHSHLPHFDSEEELESQECEVRAILMAADSEKARCYGSAAQSEARS